LSEFGPQTPESDLVHAAKYRGQGESFKEGCNRQASALTDSDEHFKPFRDVLLNMRFMPGGRIQSAVGSTRVVTPYNCFVAGTIQDSLREGDGSITKRFDEAMGTMQLGGGIGYDFSTLRPRGAMIKKLQTHSAGPIPFMGIFNAGCDTVSAAGHRRGAQMGVLRVDHPDIEEFIHMKQNDDAMEAFNVSIAVTDEFMHCVQDDGTFWLQWNGEKVREIKARALWETIMRSTWDWSEPGVIFIDRINEMNNLWYCETIAATNPCGEQPLPPHGACLLGSFNLTKYLKDEHGRLGESEHGRSFTYSFDYDQFEADIPLVVRAMDRVVDIATYPLWEQEQEAKSKRRMGLGITGTANAIEAMGYRYGSEDYIHIQEKILTILRNETYRASIELAKEKGPFPLFDARYTAGEFIQTLPDDIRQDIAKHGIRNSHLTSIAPTGTISLTADNVSSGIEPVFAYEVDRAIDTATDGKIIRRFKDYGHAFLGVSGKTVDQVTAAEHVAVLQSAQRFVDSAVSKTCNVTGEMPWEDFKDIYMKAWEAGCKGCTTYNIDGKRGAVLKAAEPKEGAACYIDPTTGRKECE
jgi:ribonucleoside-diphosphate reductase alpha chain